MDGLNCSPAAESGDVVQSWPLGCRGTVSAKCQPQQSTPSTQQSLRVLQENLASTLFHLVDVTVYLWVSTSLCKCSTCIQQLSGGACPGEPVEEEGEEGMLCAWEEGELHVAYNR